MLGPKAPPALSESASFHRAHPPARRPLLVINDEAHHTHDEDNAWNSVIRDLHAARPVAAQLDFSATPRFTKGQLFPWVISDYPLKQAIIDGVVKRPYKGVTDLSVVASEIASVKYRGFIVAGVNRWREYREQLAPLGKRPLLFIMLTNNSEADEVGAFLAEALSRRVRRRPDAGHPHRPKGDVTQERPRYRAQGRARGGLGRIARSTRW